MVLPQGPAKWSYLEVLPCLPIETYISQIGGSNLHWYGKSKEIVGRKMAHITFLLNEDNQSKRVEKSKEILNKVREIWPSPND